jgi:glycosyltransferase involved in cell wall biosynthesis
MSPIVSFIIPCYNGGRWLSLSLDSVSSQSHTDFEVIIVDDGSTDNSAEIVERYSREDERYRYVWQKNSGIAAALNLGLSLARGQWIARLDTDDVCDPHRIKRQLELASASNNVVFVGSDSIQIDSDGRPIRRCNYPVTHRQLYRALTTRRKFPAHSSAFFDRAVAISVGGYRESVRRAEDVDLWLRLSEHGQLISAPLPLIAYRTHDTQISLDEGGLRCFSDNLLANLSHFSRRNQIADPLEASSTDLQSVSLFIDIVAKKSAHFKLIGALTEWRQQRQKISTDYISTENFKNFLNASAKLAWLLFFNFVKRKRDDAACQKFWIQKAHMIYDRR